MRQKDESTGKGDGPAFHCEPWPRLRTWGGIRLRPGQLRPDFAQLAARLAELPQADRAAWFAAHRRAMKRKPLPKRR